MAQQTMKTGDKVTLRCDIWEEGEDLPPGIIARRGEVVVVRKVHDDESRYHWDLSVSHEHITDRSFGVNSNEITEGATKCPIARKNNKN